MSAARDSPSSVVRCATIKQAKAAYKARGRPTLSEAEQRQLERNVKLDQRAWAIREREKKRAETAKKRVEKEHQERKRQADLLGTQRRCDRFGHKSSQFHLGAFFAAGAARSPLGDREGSMSPGTSRYDSMEDDSEAFGDDGVDDDDLLSAMDVMTHAHKDEHTSGSDSAITTAQDRPPASPRPRRPSEAEKPAAAPSLRQTSKDDGKNAAPVPPMAEDLSMFLDELGSGTQIARELEAEEVPPAEKAENEFVSSFGSADFDFTMDDLEAIESPSKPPSQTDKRTSLTPPPRLRTSARNQSNAGVTSSSATSMGSPPRPPPSRRTLQSVSLAPPNQSHTAQHSMVKPVPATGRFKNSLPAPFRSASEMWTGTISNGPNPAASTNNHFRKSIPPPRMPPSANRMHPPPGIPPRRPPPAVSLALKTATHSATRNPQGRTSAEIQVTPIDSGLTMSQLERCIEDDFQLTQA